MFVELLPLANIKKIFFLTNKLKTIGKTFQPKVMIASKAGAYPSDSQVLHSLNGLWPYPQILE